MGQGMVAIISLFVEGFVELRQGLVQLFVEVPVLVGLDFPDGFFECQVVLRCRFLPHLLYDDLGLFLGGALDIIVLLDVETQCPGLLGCLLHRFCEELFGDVLFGVLVHWLLSLHFVYPWSCQ